MTRRLAIDGGRPAFEEPRITGVPNVVPRSALLERLNGALDRGRLTNHGPLVAELEERISDHLGVGAIAVSNGTQALLVAGRALGLGGRIAVPSWTFVGTAHAVKLLGAEPVFVDVDDDHVMDPIDLASRATRGPIDGIMPVHLFGRACDVGSIGTIGASLGAPVLYDGAQSLGTTTSGRDVTAFGDATAISLHATKWFSAVEGGLIAATDEGLLDECRQLRNFGFTGPVSVPTVGTNAKLSELHAAYALAMFERIDELAAANEARYAAYAAALAGVPGVRLVDTGPTGTTARPYVVAELDAAHRHHRDDLWRALWAEGVQACRYFTPGVHRLEVYAGVDPGAELPTTERLAASCLALPTGDSISVTDANLIGELLAELLGRAAAGSATASWADPGRHADASSDSAATAAATDQTVPDVAVGV